MNLLMGYIVPHPPILIVGDVEEKAQVASTIKAYQRVKEEIRSSDAELIVLITPHGPVFVDGLCVYDGEQLNGDFSKFGHREITGIWDNDIEFVECLQEKSSENGVPLVKMDQQLIEEFNLTSSLDHGAMVPLYLLGEALEGKKVVVINYGLLQVDALYQFGRQITATLEAQNKKGVVIASGDLSHYLSESGPYGYRKEGEVFDQMYVQAFEDSDLKNLLFVDPVLLEQAGECGKRSIEILLGTFDYCDFTSEKFSYEAPFGIGYLLGRLMPKNSASSKMEEVLQLKKEILHAQHNGESDVVQLARAAIKHYLIEGRTYAIQEKLSIEASGKRSGVFVSLKDAGGLRGCMGSTGGIAPTVEEEIVDMAIKAATRDPRFNPVEPEELEGLTISVDILSASEEVGDKSELDPKNYGVIVSSGYKQGLLLPNLEGIDTVEDQLSIALNKAGINPDQETYKMYKFTVKRYY